MDLRRILLLCGGESNEREVSLRSGLAVYKALKVAGYNIRMADTARKNFDLTSICEDIDVILPILHGAGGEDGVIQKQIEVLGIKYFGSGPEACALTFDKVICKERLAENGVLTPLWEVVDRQQFNLSTLRRRSFVLKPISGGSTIDTLIVHNPQHTQLEGDAMDSLFRQYKYMLLEELIEGQEITVGIVGERALPVIQIVPPKGEEFDYTNKYNGKTREIPNPSDISRNLQREAQRLALRVHHITGCQHISRTDMIIDASGAMYVLEINTMPGMTEQSLIPKAALELGVKMEELVTQFVELSDKRYE